MESKRLIEAALFMSGKPLSLQALGKLINVAAPGFVEREIKKLNEELAERGSAIEIAKEVNGYVMRLRPEYVKYVKDFAQEAEISKHALRTLAYVSKNNGITKARLCKILGSGIYADIKELVEKGFIEQKKAGRTSSLHLTKKFKEYFAE